MTSTIEFVFDFGSPNAYCAYHAIGPVAQRHGATVKILPCLLGGIFKETGNQAPMITFAKIKGKLEYERLEFARFLNRYALTKFKFNPHFPVNTVMLMRGAVVAEMEGDLERYVEAGLKMMWEDGLKMDDPEVFVSAFTEAGFDGQHLATRIQEDDVKARLFENTSAAIERGAFGVPTFYVDGEMYFGKERIVQIEEQISGG
ncbi:MAG: 2-hydroxychromene-2-carboxylate isomerase [Pseudomonadota bacterium]